MAVSEDSDYVMAANSMETLFSKGVLKSIEAAMQQYAILAEISLGFDGCACRCARCGLCWLAMLDVSVFAD